MAYDFREGQRVGFMTAGRYPKHVTGTIKSLHQSNPLGFAEIDTDETPSRVLKARPASLKAI